MDSESRTPDGSKSEATSNQDWMKDFQDVIENYAQAIQADDPEKADQAAMAALIMAGIHAMEHPTPELELAEQASEHLAAGNWQAAEEDYRKLIALEERTGTPGLTTKPLMDLSKLCCLLDRLEEGWVYARAATEAARPAEINTLLAMALECEATCALRRGRPEEALVAAEEALRVIDPGRLGDLMRTMAQANRGHALLGLGEVAKAEEALETAWSILRSRKQSRIGSGPVVAFAKCFELEAELRAQQKRWPEAVSALRQAIQQRRTISDEPMAQSPFPAAGVARNLERLAVMLGESGETVAAEESLKEAAELWRKVQLPGFARGGKRK